MKKIMFVFNERERQINIMDEKEKHMENKDRVQKCRDE